MTEIWKDIVGYEGYYQVSNLGKVKSLERNTIRDGIPFLVKEKLMNPNTEKGYLRVCLSKEKIERKKFVHRLIAEAWIQNPRNLKQVNHKNGIRDDNRIENLEWVSARENVSHGVLRVKSKLIGVTKEKSRTPNNTKIWRANIHVDGVQRRIGYFYSEEEAHQAYLNALKSIGVQNRYTA